MKIEVYSPTIRRKEMDAVLTVMVEEKIGPGDRSRLLTQTVKEQLRFDYALTLRSPAVALHLALKAIMSEAPLQAAQPAENSAVNTEKKAVIVSALSPLFYLQVINDLQLTPLFCDVSYEFPCMSREGIENTIAKKPPGVHVCAIVLHHTLGFVPDASSIAELGIPVIEDISQSYGSRLAVNTDETQKEKGEPLIKVSGALCILGLEERDMLTSGGGALLFAMARKDGSLLRSFAGLPDEYCLPDINAALAVVQFKEIFRNTARRRDIAEVYTKASMSLATRTKHRRFISVSDNENSYCFPLLLEAGLKDVLAYAKKKEIVLENAFEKTIAGSGLCEGCPVSSSLALRTVLFPMYPRLRSQEVERVSRLIMTLP